jgi:hypothetical protein
MGLRPGARHFGAGGIDEALLRVELAPAEDAALDEQMEAIELTLQFLQTRLGAPDIRARGSERRLRLIELGPGTACANPDERLSAAHRVAVLRKHLHYGSARLRIDCDFTRSTNGARQPLAERHGSFARLHDLDRDGRGAAAGVAGRIGCVRAAARCSCERHRCYEYASAKRTHDSTVAHRRRTGINPR